MGSSTGNQPSFNVNFRRNFWQYTDILGGIGTASLEVLFSRLSAVYTKTFRTSTMELVMYDGNMPVSFYLFKVAFEVKGVKYDLLILLFLFLDLIHSILKKNNLTGKYVGSPPNICLKMFLFLQS